MIGSNLSDCVIGWLQIPQYEFKYCTYGKPKPDNKVHGANMGPIWGRQVPDGPHVGPMNFVIWDVTFIPDLEIALNAVYMSYWLPINTNTSGLGPLLLIAQLLDADIRLFNMYLTSLSLY